MKEWLLSNLNMEDILLRNKVVEWEDLYFEYLTSGVDPVTIDVFRAEVDSIISEAVGFGKYVIVTDQYIFSVPKLVFELYEVCDEYWKKNGKNFALLDAADYVTNEKPMLSYTIGSKFKNEIVNYFIRCRRCRLEKNAQGKKFITIGKDTKKIKKISFIKNKIQL